MKIKRYLITVLCSALCVTQAWAGSLVSIAGTGIPLIEGAQPAGREAVQAHARIATYAVSRPVTEVADFYLQYFKENGFVVLGGKENGALDVAVSKDAVMFSLKVFSEGGTTLVQFIW